MQLMPELLSCHVKFLVYICFFLCNMKLLLGKRLERDWGLPMDQAWSVYNFLFYESRGRGLYLDSASAICIHLSVGHYSGYCYIESCDPANWIGISFAVSSEMRIIIVSRMERRQGG
jgi:hypothetical protein